MEGSTPSHPAEKPRAEFEDFPSGRTETGSSVACGLEPPGAKIDGGNGIGKRWSWIDNVCWWPILRRGVRKAVDDGDDDNDDNNDDDDDDDDDGDDNDDDDDTDDNNDDDDDYCFDLFRE
ncbi:hypothetical protein PoB_007075400 [Plakobranchus ocellatus]|uniref:Uncharacterized protein n=1 Tax=Plakobranchus ocellatus TaxID=259542 RepID=A0AAV4DJN6_9GAST|nr:hypothetical protein PoB_007075400 [Plakobranchus ocellatus]